MKIHAQTTRPATPQRTAENRFTEPTPTIEPVIVCVVLTGMAPMSVSTSVKTNNAVARTAAVPGLLCSRNSLYMKYVNTFVLCSGPP